MAHPSHKTNTYKDGFTLVWYCTVCGVEDGELTEPCCGELKTVQKNDTRTQNKVDTKSEPS
jgi:hypothetical protein